MHIKLISSSSNFESHPCQLKNTENKHQHAVTKLRLKLHFRGCHFEVVEKIKTSLCRLTEFQSKIIMTVMCTALWWTFINISECT